MIIGSGSVVHSFKYMNAPADQLTFSNEFDTYIKEAILSGNHDSAIAYNTVEASHKAVPTKEHFAPLLYILGASVGDAVEVVNEAIVFGSFSMTSYIFT